MPRTIRGLRKDLEMSREDYAKAIGVTPSAVSRFEQWKSVPDVVVAIKIMKLSKIESINDIKWEK